MAPAFERYNNKKVEKLISFIKANECMYDPSHEEYKNTPLKMVLWKKIADELDATAKDLKHFWKNLRDCHRDATKRKQLLLKSGRKYNTIKKWKYFDQMAFILPHMTTRESGNKILVDMPVMGKMEPIDLKDEIEIDPMEGVEDPQIDDEDDDDDDQLLCAPAQSTSRFRSSIVSRSFDTQVEYMQLSSDGKIDYDAISTNEKHPLDSFFDTIRITTRGLPTKYQLEIKRKVFQIVSEAEEKYLEDQNENAKFDGL